MTQADGVTGVPRLESDIKLIYAVATNCLINQHANVNRSAEILRDEKKVEFIVVQDNFLTSTARFADIILPACTQFETWGVEDGWKYGDEVILQPKLVDPPGECKSDYQICSEIAARLGLGEAYTEGRDEKAWVDYCLGVWRSTRFPDLPSLDEFIKKDLGAWSNPVTQPAIAFQDFRRNPEQFPLQTPSGKIEIFSTQLYDRHNPAEIPPVPKYIQEWENPFSDTDYAEKRGENQKEKIRVPPCSSASQKEFPLQAIGHHNLHRVHSTHDNNDWLGEAFPQRIFINPIDAVERGICDGDLVRAWNERGELVLPARVTPRILPGVVDIPQGAWWSPNESKGGSRSTPTDFGGCINVLTSERWTPFAFGSAQQTIMVQVEKTVDGGRQTVNHGSRSMVNGRKAKP
jgi:anaerobic dimethyl sulfoxide reductase subunit A